MTILTESLKRLFDEGKTPLSKIKELLKNKKITQKEYDYIVNK